MRWTQFVSVRLHAMRTKHKLRTAKSCGPGAATLAPRPWRYVGAKYRAGNGGKKGRFPGESTKETVKTIARGKPGCLGCTCGSTRVLSQRIFCTRDCGRSRRPAFPAPSRREARTFR